MSHLPGVTLKMLVVRRDRSIVGENWCRMAALLLGPLEPVALVVRVKER